MRRLFIGSASLALGMMLVAAPAAAQFFVGAGVTSRTGDQGDDIKTGWMATGGVSPWATENNSVRIWIEGMFGQNKATDDVDATSTHGECREDP